MKRLASATNIGTCTHIDARVLISACQRAILIGRRSFPRARAPFGRLVLVYCVGAPAPYLASPIFPSAASRCSPQVSAQSLRGFSPALVEPGRTSR